jgi:hypothetical protein
MKKYTEEKNGKGAAQNQKYARSTTNIKAISQECNSDKKHLWNASDSV